jgi:hypothetical protein
MTCFSPGPTGPEAFRRPWAIVASSEVVPGTCYATPSSSLTASSGRSSAAAARFSRKCAKDEVPGIKRMLGAQRSSQASATCMGVAPTTGTRIAYEIWGLAGTTFSRGDQLIENMSEVLSLRFVVGLHPRRIKEYRPRSKPTVSSGGPRRPTPAPVGSAIGHRKEPRQRERAEPLARFSGVPAPVLRLHQLASFHCPRFRTAPQSSRSGRLVRLLARVLTKGRQRHPRKYQDAFAR